MNPILLTDYYKTEHFRMYPEGTTMIYSNLTPRKSRVDGVDSIIFFGLQHFVKKYLLDKFKTEFFNKPWEEVEEEYKYAIHTETGHIKALHELGYLPIKIKALPEGSRCPIRVPCMTIRNTLPEFFWLTNYLETLISCQLWQPITSATLAAEYWKILSKYAKETTGSDDGVQWQAHDFSMRGMSSVESAILSGMGHLTSFTGTDTIPAIYALRDSYRAEGLIGASVPATEHSVMCMGTKDDEVGTFSNLLDLYPSGILSVVSDTWDLWKVLTEYLPILKDKILGRDGKLVIRPDSGDPVDIICGLNTGNNGEYQKHRSNHKDEEPAWKGVIELLWDTFGGKINEYGYKVLNPCVGAIYGDSINLDRAQDICKRLKAKGFASTNVVLGVGSYTYQYNTRDTFGFAVKATYGELTEMEDMTPEEHGFPVMDSTAIMIQVIKPREIFKDPITDDGTKKSLKGLLSVRSYDRDNKQLYVKDQCTRDEEENSLLETVFEDGKLVREQILDDIRKRIKS
jgi:nicotinamide phosphoribosyltransferase